MRELGKESRMRMHSWVVWISFSAEHGEYRDYGPQPSRYPLPKTYAKECD